MSHSVSEKKKAGYEYLLAYKVTVPVYDYTVLFCNIWIPKGSRTHDQMVQSARSGMQNVAEGYAQGRLSGYITLVGVAKGSLEELLNDYLSFARQRKLPIWEKGRVIREIGEIREIWGVLRRTPTLPDTPNFPDLPDDPEKAVNLLITLVYQAKYLQEKLYASLLEKHRKEGGFHEKLLQDRMAFRNKGAWGTRGTKGGTK